MDLYMVWMEWAFFVAGGLLVVASVWAFVEGMDFLRLVRRAMQRPHANYAPPAAVVIPCKGVDAEFDSSLERFLMQDYPHYQVIFAVATAGELAHRRLQARLDARGAARRSYPTSLVVAGLSGVRGEKVNNLLCGVAAVDPSMELLVFADIDCAPAGDWLRSLVAPLADPLVTVSTGFRWYLPGAGFVSKLRAAWDTSIATLMGDHNRNFAWGGSMAMRVADFRALGIAERYWAATVSDDYAVTRAVREANGRIAFEPRCLVASREESTLADFLHWSTRQIIITRVYAAHLWRLGLANYLYYCGTLALGFILLAWPGTPAWVRIAAALTLLAVLVLGAGKGAIRSAVTRELFGAEAGSGHVCYWLLAPLVPWVMLWNFVAAGFTRRIEWRGTGYELISQDRVRVTRRSGD